MTLEGIRLKLKKIYIKKTATFRKKKLKDTDFTIISNKVTLSKEKGIHTIKHNAIEITAKI